MFCRKCGQMLPDGAKFCTNCGADTGADGTQNAADNQNQNAQNSSGGQNQTYTGTVMGSGGSNGPIKNRNIVTCILLSLVTCGIYGLIWLAGMADDLNTASGDTNGTTGITVVLLSIVTCSIYLFFWMYKAGGQVNRAKAARGIAQDSNTGILYLILSIFGLSIVSYCLIQNELNQMAPAA